MNHFQSFDPVVRNAARTLVIDHLRIQAGESVLLTTDTHSDPVVGHVLLDACVEAGARPVIAHIPKLPLQGKLADAHLPDALRAAMASSDCWIDLTHPYIAGSDAHDNAVKAGRTRCLVAGGMDCTALAHLYAGVALDTLYGLQHAMDTLIAESTGKPCRLTDDRGTDVSFVLGKNSGSKPRHATQPGVTYSLPGSVVMYPELESVRGRIVIVGAMHDWYGALDQPLTLEVDGRIRSIVEEGPEAQLLDRALRRAGGGEYGHVIHFSYGLHPAARRRGNCFVEDIRVIGANAIGFGRPWWEPGGGENHPDGVLFGQNLWIEGQQILRAGLVVSPSSMSELAASLRAHAGPF